MRPISDFWVPSPFGAGQGEPDGGAARSSRSWPSRRGSSLRRACRRSSRPCTAQTPDCRRLSASAACRRCEPAGGVQPLDEGRLRQRVAARRSLPGFRWPSSRSQAMASGVDEGGIGGGVAWLTWAQMMLVSRECCHVARMVPSATTAGLVFGSTGLGLKKCVVTWSPSLAEQRGLRREEHEGNAGARGQADVVLRADGMAHEERFRSRRHLDVGGHRRRLDLVGVRALRQPDCEQRRESGGRRGDPLPAINVVI